MFRNMFILAIVLFAPLATAHGQILNDSSFIPNNSSQVRVGTTTFDIDFQSTRLQSVESRLQQILFYLRSFDSEAAIRDVSRARYTPLSVYNDVIDNAFETAPNQDTRAIDTIVDIANSEIERSRTENGNDISCFTFTRSLRLGDRGPEVLELQRFLNRHNFQSIAEEGPGSPGQETDYFGSLTLAAVRSYQERYRAEILEPLDLSFGTGYWGERTYTHANGLDGCQ